MVATLHPPLLDPSPAPFHSVDLKANGEVSRMRSHKGNIPSLPQTKYCPLCPAKFTRTTHLNRHLRSHTNERLHHCNTCTSQFTRSDLLTRHKRTCGDPMHVNRSRRKSCQSCAESKIKCDLQYPCSKCVARGRQCVFINNPEASRMKRFVSSQRIIRHPDPPTPTNAKPLNNFTSLPSSSGVFGSPALSFSSASSLDFPISGSSPSIAISQFSKVDPRNSSGPFSSSSFENSAAPSTSSSPASDDSPCSDIFESCTDITFPLDFGVDGEGCAQLPKLSLDCTLEPLFDKVFTSSAVSAISPEFAFWTAGSGGALSHDTFTHPSSYNGLATFPSSTFFEYPTFTVENISLFSPFSPRTPQLAYAKPLSGCTALVHGRPSANDLQHYLFLFFSAFSRQLPLIHPATWHQQGKHHLLVQAMQACGALFANTRNALDFISATLYSTREAIAQAIANNPLCLTEQTDVVLAIILLQSLGLFHRRKHDAPVKPAVYHTTLVTMLRRSALVQRVASWTPMDLSNLSSIESTWRDWANHETLKRALLLSYLQDCYHCFHFSNPSSFQSSEFDIQLPCDEALWNASSSGEWFEALHAPSPYGTGIPRLIGVNMGSALASIGQIRTAAHPVLQNPFANFLLMHSLLTSQDSVETSPLSGMLPTRKQGPETAVSAHYALYNWLQAWLHCPVHVPYAKCPNGTPFVLNALPFHWLLQLSLIARHAAGLVSVPGYAALDCTGIVMSCWLDQVRVSLAKGEPISSRSWDEFATIRIHISQLLDTDCESIDQDGLLAFFPRN